MNLNNILIVLFSFCLGCSPKPEEINYGSDQCAYCKMNIVDPKFGAEIVTAKGRIYKFDAIECMVRYDLDQQVPVHDYLVNCFTDPGKLHPVESCQFLISTDVPSPMGAGLSAYARDEKIPHTAAMDDANLFTWQQLPAQLTTSK